MAKAKKRATRRPLTVTEAHLWTCLRAFHQGHRAGISPATLASQLGLSQRRLGKDLSVPSRRINEIVLGKREISPDTALRLSRFFGLTERFWLNLQSRYDLEIEKDLLANRLEREVRVYQASQQKVRA